ncbi:uncharacterized protein C8Q71DRAFT_689884, partial [Rhodofomes roseus]
LTLRDSDNDLMMSICTSMPVDLRASLTERLISCFPTDPLNVLDTATISRSEPLKFQALHFSWYNRHCTRGHDAPVDVPPRKLRCANRSRTNYAQMLPYPSKDIEEHHLIYDALKTILNDVFCWLDKTVSALLRILPQEYSHLEASASILPDHHTSPVHPFLGLVINMNIATYAHRDSKDNSICLVLPIGYFDGGELCLLEAGLVVPLQHAQLCVFPS